MQITFKYFLSGKSQFGLRTSWFLVFLFLWTCRYVTDMCELRRVFVFWAGLGSNLTNCKKSTHCSTKPQSTRYKILELFCVDCFFAKWGNKGVGECRYSLTKESRWFSTKMQHFPFHSFRVLELHIMGRVMLSNKIKSLKVFSAMRALRRSCDYFCYVTNVM